MDVALYHKELHSSHHLQSLNTVFKQSQAHTLHLIKIYFIETFK